MTATRDRRGKGGPPLFGLVWRTVKGAARGFVADDILRHAAALAFYTLLSLAPLVVVLLIVLDALGGEGARQLAAQVGRVVGPDGERTVLTIAESANREDVSRGWASVIGLLTLAFSATGVFAELQGALNHIWRVEPRPEKAWLGWLRKRVLSFAMLGALAFLLLVSLAATTFIGYVARWSPEGVLLQIATQAVSVVIYALHFAAMFRVLPDVRLAWRDVLSGAIWTALLFTVGKWAIGAYLTHKEVGDAYGTASSLVVVVVWVYFTSVVVLFGAELTEAWATARGRRLSPNDFANGGNPAEKPKPQPTRAE
jgi:membrane protein